MISIIIPTLNEEKYLPQLLVCIYKQKFKDYEIIVSDGSSNDHTVQIAKKFRCRVVSRNKRSPAVQRNAGAGIAKGDVLLFLDADSELRDWFLEKSIKEFEDRNLDLGAYYFTLNSKKLLYRLATIHAYIMTYLIHFFHPIGVGAALMVKKSVHTRTGGFDETIVMGEDHVYCLNAVKHGARYGLMRSSDILFNVRRFEKEGPFRLAWKWYYIAFYYVFHGPIRKQVLPYEFGSYS